MITAATTVVVQLQLWITYTPYPKAVLCTMRTITHIVVHCSATGQDAKVEAIQRYWKEKLGWKSPGYHYIIEADDVIGHLAQTIDGKVWIASSDRDYLQLVSDRVTVFSPTKKKFYDQQMVLNEYGVTSQNFLTQKVLLGDSGDNVPGVKGLGSKTLIKLFPELSGEAEVSIEEILDKCKKEDKKLHSSILAFERQLHINKQLMNLKEINIPAEALEEINSLILNPNKEMDSLEFVKLYNEDNLGNSINNIQAWLFNNFKTIQHYK